MIFHTICLIHSIVVVGGKQSISFCGKEINVDTYTALVRKSFGNLMNHPDGPLPTLFPRA